MDSPRVPSSKFRKVYNALSINSSWNGLIYPTFGSSRKAIVTPWCIMRFSVGISFARYTSDRLEFPAYGTALSIILSLSCHTLKAVGALVHLPKHGIPLSGRIFNSTFSESASEFKLETCQNVRKRESKWLIGVLRFHPETSPLCAVLLQSGCTGPVSQFKNRTREKTFDCEIHKRGSCKANIRKKGLVNAKAEGSTSRHVERLVAIF